METDDIILKVLFFLIIIILIVCPIRKLMEGFISSAGVIVKNVSRSGLNKAFNGDTITFTMTTNNTQNNPPKITIKFGGADVVKSTVMDKVDNNKKKWTY